MTYDLQSAAATDAVLRSDASLAGTPEGRLAATIELHGELCAATAPQLHEEISRLIDDGANQLVIDLTDLRLCTARGLDIFDRAHQRLRDSGDGAVRLQNARGVVDRVLAIVEDADPSFPALRQRTGPGR